MTNQNSHVSANLRRRSVMANKNSDLSADPQHKAVLTNKSYGVCVDLQRETAVTNKISNTCSDKQREAVMAHKSSDVCTNLQQKAVMINKSSDINEELQRRSILKFWAAVKRCDFILERNPPSSFLTFPHLLLTAPLILLLSALLLLLLPCTTAQSGNDSTGLGYYGVRLQSEGVPTTASYIRWKNAVPTMSTVTVCLHLFLSRTRSALTPLLSYSVPEFQDELLIYMDWDNGALVVVCCGGNGRVEHLNVFNFSLLHSWIHLCVALDLKAWRYTASLGSDIIMGDVINLSGEDLVVKGGGILIVGQEQDLHGEGFSVEQSFEGIVANMIVYPQYMRERRLREYALCEFMRVDTSVVSFSSLAENWEVFGDTLIVTFTEEDLCGPPAPVNVVFPEPRTLKESQVLCHMLKGRLSAPRNEKENQAIVEESRDRTDVCTSSWGAYLWLGVRAHFSDGQWDYLNMENNKTVPYTNFRLGYARPFASYNCIFMDSYEVGKWVVYPCSLKTCTVCSFSKMATLRLRGLCADSLLDRMYVISGVKNGKPVFIGVGNTEIYWNNSTWVMIDHLHPDISANMTMTELMQYPSGLRHWNISGDKCPDKQPALLLTACSEKQYTCNDGTCIRKMQRCDLEVNCPDQSDERLCKAVVVPSDYIREVPPARVGNDPATIHMLVVILSMQPIDTANMKMTLDLTITMVWRDPRLAMESLNYADTRNVIHDQSTIWRPELLFQDLTGTQAETTLQWETFVVVMESGPDPDDITRVREDEVYPGETNSLKLTQTYSVRVTCQMNLGDYPFDGQICTFNLRLQDFTRDLVALSTPGTSVNYLGATNLREYELRSVEMIQADWKNHSGQEIRFRLVNLSGFYVSSTYVPTFLMVIICYSTLFFEMDDFQDRIMVSLTALLVLATLFTQITETTPTTSYLKLLDTWFVACILVNFSICILLVVINYLRMMESDAAAEVVPFNKNKRGNFYALRPSRCRQLNKASQIAIPIILVILVLAYTGLTLRKNF